MSLKKFFSAILLTASASCAFAQTDSAVKDSIYIEQIENHRTPDKVLHAEPLYIDLIRDLGARKGEKEVNVGLGLTDNTDYDAYEALVEYEWAPIDRLGLEVELPFTIYAPVGTTERDSLPSDRLNSLKIAAQWSFYVNEANATSMALGYINEFEMTEFSAFGNPLIKGNVYNPFLIVAKRWGTNFHSLIYTGPMIEQNFKTNRFHTTYEMHTSFHYMLTGTRNFIGVELNKSIDQGDFDMTIRPQMRLEINEHLLIGIVAGIPVGRENERLSSFVRLIWEPGRPGH